MSKNIFLTATNTDIGKTFASLILIEEFSKLGYRVGVFKPIETGVEEFPKDGEKLLKRAKEFNHLLKDFTIDDIVPFQFKLPASPFVAKKKKKIKFKKIKEAYKKISKVSDIVIIEGAGGLMVPIKKNFFMVDFISYFKATPLLVTPSKLGSINDTLLSIEALKKRKKKFIWAINLYRESKSFKKITLPYYKKRFKKIYYLQKDREEIVKKLNNL